MLTDLSLRRDYKVYMFKPNDNVLKMRPESSLYHYWLDGMLEHPNVHLVDFLEEADVSLHLIQYTNISSDKRFLNDSSPPYKRLVILDEVDGFTDSWHRIFYDYKNLAHFKRSFVNKNLSNTPLIDQNNGRRDLGYGYWTKKHNYFPFVYGIADRYVHSLWNATQLFEFDEDKNRPISVLCTLRDWPPKAYEGARKTVLRWLREFNSTGEITGMAIGDVDNCSRDKSCPGYVDRMKSAKIIVTANPGEWEGDFR